MSNVTYHTFIPPPFCWIDVAVPIILNMSFMTCCTFGAQVQIYVEDMYRTNNVDGVLGCDSAYGSNLSLASPASNSIVAFALVMSSF